jgi:K+:H+ antiporter
MLARIIYERGITGTPLGTLAFAAGAIDDATAWCVLAVVLASFGGGPMVALQAIVGGLLYGLFTLTIGRKLLRGLMELIILNIGLQKGMIQPALFSIMVIMAIVTTLIALQKALTQARSRM